MTTHQNLSLFGTDGIRALIGHHCFTDEGIIKLGHALAQWITEKYKNSTPILIGHDTRNSASWIKNSLSAILTRYGHTVYDADAITTPMLCWLTKNDPLIECGIMISASHNSWIYNGIKLCDKKQGKISAEDEDRITFLAYNHVIPALNTQSLGSTVPYTFTHLYYDALVTHFKPQFLEGLTVILDCANGATASIAPALFRSFGATVITYADTPTGFNINDECGTLYPAHLQKKVRIHYADIGFAFDGDGDRIIAVSRDGELRDGDDILTLLSQHPNYKKESSTVGTVMSNYGFESWLAQKGKKLLRTSVGDKHVSEMLNTQNLFLGGEQSGHIIMRDFLYTGDGIYTALRLLETMLITNNRDFVSFTKYPQFLINVPLISKEHVTQEKLDALTHFYQKKLTNGRILLRTSGTEPIIRVMVEDSDAQCAQEVSAMLAAECKELTSTPK